MCQAISVLSITERIHFIKRLSGRGRPQAHHLPLSIPCSMVQIILYRHTIRFRVQSLCMNPCETCLADITQGIVAISNMFAVEMLDNAVCQEYRHLGRFRAIEPSSHRSSFDWHANKPLQQPTNNERSNLIAILYVSVVLEVQCRACSCQHANMASPQRPQHPLVWSHGQAGLVTRTWTVHCAVVESAG